MFDRPPGNRRDFLRSLLGRAAESVPDAVATAAAAMTGAGRSTIPTVGRLDDDALARAISIPPDQRDLAEALVRHGRLQAVSEGRYAERFALGPVPGGPATAQWLGLVRAGTPPQRTRPRDVMLVAAARAELAEE